MSGGVDSSVAAALLKKQGHDVTGVFFKPWSPTNTTFNLKFQTSNFCNWEQDRLDAMRVCAKLGIPFKTWDFSDEYGKRVTQYMINGYRSGITPNPDVMCNKEIKFGLFLKKALSEGADYIATGHYVRLYCNHRALKLYNYKTPAVLQLFAGKDKNKDQSYFLWTLTQEQLRHCLFPIGDYTKPDVRKLAKKFGLPNYNKKDSQGICFVGQFNMKEFLINYIKPKKGEIKLAGTNTTLGWHDGFYYYTIGQRHGLDIKDGRGPYYVVSKDLKKNILSVANADSTSQFTVLSTEISNVNWIADRPKLPTRADVKIRYRTEALPAIIFAQGKNLIVKFQKPAKAVTLGQSAVIYRGQETLCGGIIVSH